MINENKDPARIHLDVTPIDGSAPIKMSDIAQYVIIAIPAEDPEHKSSALLGVSPQRCAEIGIWLIQCSKVLAAGGTTLPALGEFSQKDKNSPIVQPGRLSKKTNGHPHKSGLIIP